MRNRSRTLSRATRREPPKLTLPATLPPLYVGIYRNGELCRITKVADPRQRICETFNELDLAQTARPLTAREVNIARKTAESEAAHA
jgi:hypothetical protein